MIKYVRGDMFPVLAGDLATLIVVPHVVNDAGRFGSGFAAAVMKHYPIVREHYMDWSDIGENRRALGNTQFVVAKPNLVFANMVGQHGTVSPKNPKPIKYLGLAKAMEKVADAFSNSKFGYCTDNAEIVTPLFGAGLAQGNWWFISELINEIWAGIKVTVYHLEPSHADTRKAGQRRLVPPAIPRTELI